MTPTPHSPYIDLDNVRQEDQRQVMQAILQAGTCPFCPDHLAEYHHQPILRTGRYWLLTTNQWPYPHTRHHFLAIHRQHHTRLSQIEPEAAGELITFFADLEREYQLPGGGIAWRFGDTRYSAGSVQHLHAQLIIPEINNPDFQPVRIKIGSDHKTIAEPTADDSSTT